MLILLLGTDWITNRQYVHNRIAEDVAAERSGRILMVPELISHDTERRLCKAAGNTTSRFAEVLSFTRLYRRVCDFTGCAARECLDNGGRLTAMASAVRQLHSKLKSYASVETRPEFLVGLVDSVDEFKRCCITPADLMSASCRTEGILAQKLEELSLIYEAYDGLCQLGKRDPVDQMMWLLEQLELSDFAQKHVFYIDGFPDFTGQHMAILEHLIAHSPQVTIALNCDSIQSQDPAFETAGRTASDLYAAAVKAGVEVKIQTVSPRTDRLQPMRANLFAGPVSTRTELKECLHLFRADSMYDECMTAAERIIDLVRSGVRYRDISVVCPNMEEYQNTIHMVFDRCKIPVYQSGNDDILEKPIIATVLSAVDAALSGFDTREMIRYARSMLSPLSMDSCDRVENYVIIWNIRGNRWTENWCYHPGGLNQEWTDADRDALDRLNGARTAIMEPLVFLRDGFQHAVSVREQILVLYHFLEKIDLATRLNQLSRQLQKSGDRRNAQMLNQLWEILLSALEQLHDILGNTAWDTESFTRLLRLLLSQYNVGSIPPVLDSVTVGPVNAMRCQEEMHLFILGALEGDFPGYSGATGVLTDQERTVLRSFGIPLTGSGVESMQSEFAGIYGVFCGAKESVYLSCPSGQPSFICRRLLKMVGLEESAEYRFGAAQVDSVEAAAFLARFDAKQAAADLGIANEYNKVASVRNHTLGTLTPENIRTLYGEKLTLSASQVDRQAECRLLYFLRYGLRAKERKEATVDPSEFGTFVHDVLENTVNDVMQKGGFHAVSWEDTLVIAQSHADAYVKTRFDQLDSERLQYLLSRNEQELIVVVRELWEELKNSAFQPAFCELGFGYGGELDAIPIDSPVLPAYLGGRVDRVDCWNNGDQNYYRVVDYKTGRKDFDYCDVFNGYGLQMLLYLFALEDSGQEMIGEAPIPAGVQYFPARSPVIPADGLLTDEEAASLRAKLWKRKGLLLADEAVVAAMDPSEKSARLSCTVNKDGELIGDIADRTQFRLLRTYIFLYLRKLVEEIASGEVRPNPYTRGARHNACTYCPYGSVCYSAEVEGRRNYKAMSSQRFWEEVERVVKEDG